MALYVDPLYVDPAYFVGDGGAYVDACYWAEGYLEGDLVCEIALPEVGGDNGAQRRKQIADDDEVLMLLIQEFMETINVQL